MIRNDFFESKWPEVKEPRRYSLTEADDEEYEIDTDFDLYDDDDAVEIESLFADDIQKLKALGYSCSEDGKIMYATKLAANGINMIISNAANDQVVNKLIASIDMSSIPEEFACSAEEIKLACEEYIKALKEAQADLAKL